MPDALQQEANNDAAGPGRSRAKVVANLPYNLTKSILRRLLPLGDHINELHLMVQVPMQVSLRRVSCRLPPRLQKICKARYTLLLDLASAHGVG